MPQTSGQPSKGGTGRLRAVAGTAVGSPYPEFHTYRDCLDQLKSHLLEHRYLALVLIDVSPMNRIEHDYGSLVYEKLAREVISDLKAKQLRSGDLVVLDERAGDVFLVFLLPRSGDEQMAPGELERVGERIEAYVSRRLSKSAVPFLAERARISVGSSIALYNPLIRGERLVLRAIEEAKAAARLNEERRRLEQKQQLQRVILKQEISTLFQPIFDLRTGKPYGFEALCRGPKGSDLESPEALFDAATKSGLMFELDHVCRRQAILAGGRLRQGYKLFINTFPFSVRDPGFQGKYLINLFEGSTLAPEQLVLEVTERLVIQNYSLFIDAMKDFADMRCLIAVDDVGAGHSGLEKIVHLGPQYLKLDMHLVRDIDTSFMKQQTLQTIRLMAEKIGARLIAEGIETPRELATVREMGVDYVQGYLLAKPSAAFQTTADIKL